MRVRLSAEKPKSYVDDPKTLGQHLLKRRAELGLHQKVVAKRMEVDESSYLHWEKDQMEPKIRHWPVIIEFLGYDPSPVPDSLPGKLKARRREMGWTIREAARHAGIDPGTWGRYENGKCSGYPTTLALLRRLLNNKNK